MPDAATIQTVTRGHLPGDVDEVLLARLGLSDLLVAPVLDPEGEPDAWLAALVVGDYGPGTEPTLIRLPMRLERDGAIADAQDVVRSMAGTLRRLYPQLDPERDPSSVHRVDHDELHATIRRLGELV